MSRGLLQLLVGVFGLVPVLAGLDGMLEGAGMTGPASAPPGLDSPGLDSPGLDSPGLDSHVRYLSGLLLAIGIGFWSTIPRIEREAARFRLLTALVVAGGLGRLLGLLLHGLPPAPMLFGLAMELLVTPALCWEQRRVALRGS